MDKLKFVKIDPEGPGLYFTHSSDAGRDLFSYETTTLEPGECKKIRTNVKIVLPDGTYGRISERSSLGDKFRIGGGVIDPSYTGEIIVLIQNVSKENQEIRKYQRIAQIICTEYKIVDIEEITKMEFLDHHKNSKRMNEGFGSTN